jgi:hypothetical protein
MSLSKSRGYTRAVSLVASLAITTVLFRSVVWLSGAASLT